MPEQGLKLVLSLDAETNWYKPLAHNLSAEQASEFVQQRQSDAAGTLIVEQKNHHRAAKAEKCKACKETALEYTASGVTQKRPCKVTSKPAIEN